MRHEPRHPRLTPTRALVLLREVERERGIPDRGPARWILEKVADALEHHVAAALKGKR